MYSCSSNNPINAVDPSGLDKLIMNERVLLMTPDPKRHTLAEDKFITQVEPELKGIEKTTRGAELLKHFTKNAPWNIEINHKGAVSTLVKDAGTPKFKTLGTFLYPEFAKNKAFKVHIKGCKDDRPPSLKRLVGHELSHVATGKNDKTAVVDENLIMNDPAIKSRDKGGESETW